MIKKTIGLIFLIGIIALVVTCGLQFCGFRMADDFPRVEDAPYLAETLSRVYPCRAFEGTLENPTAIIDYWVKEDGKWRFIPGRLPFHERFGPIKIMRR